MQIETLALLLAASISHPDSWVGIVGKVLAERWAAGEWSPAMVSLGNRVAAGEIGGDR